MLLFFRQNTVYKNFKYPKNRFPRYTLAVGAFVGRHLFHILGRGDSPQIQNEFVLTKD